MPNMLEKLMLTITADEQGSASWGRVQESIVSVAHSIGNVIKQHEKLSEVSGIYGESAASSFSNLTTTGQKLAARLESITKTFTATNVAMQSMGAVADVVNFKWNEMGITAGRWSKLAGNQVVLTVIKLYAAYKALAFIISTASAAFYQAGQALADNIKTQQQVSESIARLTGETSGLTHEMERASGARIYTAAAKDLSELGKLWTSATRIGGVFASAVALIAVKFLNLYKIIPGASAAIQFFTETADSATRTFYGLTDAMTKGDAFDTKAFTNANDAITHVRENMALWATEAKVSAGEIQGTWEAMARGLGDVTLASNLLTAAMANISKGGNVSGAEMLRTFEKLATGATLSSEEIRVLGVDINTAGNEMLRSSKIFDLFIKGLVDGAATVEQLEVAKQLQENFGIRIRMMSQDVDKFLAIEKQLTRGMIEDLIAVNNVEAKTFEDRAAHLELLRKAMGAYAAQQERVNNLLGSQIKLESSTTGSGVVEKYAQQIANLQVRTEEARVLWEEGNKETAKAMFAAVKEGYAALYDSLAEGGRDFLASMEGSIALVNRLSRSMSELMMPGDVEAITTLLDEQNTRAVEAFRQRWEYEKQILANTSKGTEEYARRATAVANMAKQFRDQLIASSNESMSIITGAQQSIIELYDIQGEGIKTTLQARIAAFDAEERYQARMQKMYKGDASERARILQRQIELQKSAIEEARRAIAGADGSALSKDKGDKATERAFEKHAAAILQFIQNNPGAELTAAQQEFVKGMGEAMKRVIQQAQNTSSARRFEELLPDVGRLLESANGDQAKFIASLERTFDKTTKDLIVGNESVMRAMETMNTKLLISDKTTKDPYAGLKESVTNLKELIEISGQNFTNSQDALADFDKRQAAVLLEITGAVAQVTDAGAKFESLTNTLDAVMKDITEKFGVDVNKFGSERVEFGKHVESLGQWAMEVLMERNKGALGAGDLGSDVAAAPLTAISTDYTSAEMEAAKKAVIEFTADFGKQLEAIRSAANLTTSRKEAAITDALTEYQALMSDIAAVSTKFSEVLGVANTASFRGALVAAMAEATKESLDRRSRFIDESDTAGTLGGLVVEDVMNKLSFGLRGVLQNASTTTDPKKLANRGLPAANLVSSELAFNLSGVNAKAIASLRNQLRDVANIRLSAKKEPDELKNTSQDEAGRIDRVFKKHEAAVLQFIKNSEGDAAKFVKDVLNTFDKTTADIILSNKDVIRAYSSSAGGIEPEKPPVISNTDTVQRTTRSEEKVVIDPELKEAVKQGAVSSKEFYQRIVVATEDLVKLSRKQAEAVGPSLGMDGSKVIEAPDHVRKAMDFYRPADEERPSKTSSAAPRKEEVEKPRTDVKAEVVAVAKPENGPTLKDSVPKVELKSAAQEKETGKFDAVAGYNDVKVLSTLMTKLAQQQSELKQSNFGGYYNKAIENLDSRIAELDKSRVGILERIKKSAEAKTTPVPDKDRKDEKLSSSDEQVKKQTSLLEELTSVVKTLNEYVQTVKPVTEVYNASFSAPPAGELKKLATALKNKVGGVN